MAKTLKALKARAKKADPTYAAYDKMRTTRAAYEAAWALYEDARDAALRYERAMDQACQFQRVIEAVSDLKPNDDALADEASDAWERAEYAVATFKAADAALTVVDKRRAAAEQTWKAAEERYIELDTANEAAAHAAAGNVKIDKTQIN